MSKADAKQAETQKKTEEPKKEAVAKGAAADEKDEKEPEPVWHDRLAKARAARQQNKIRREKTNEIRRKNLLKIRTPKTEEKE